MAASKMSKAEFCKWANFTIAAKLYADGKLSAGQAAEFCGLGKVAFLNELTAYGFTMLNITSEDPKDDLGFSFGSLQQPSEKM